MRFSRSYTFQIRKHSFKLNLIVSKTHNKKQINIKNFTSVSRIKNYLRGYFYRIFYITSSEPWWSRCWRILFLVYRISQAVEDLSLMKSDENWRFGPLYKQNSSRKFSCFLESEIFLFELTHSIHFSTF